MFPSGFKEANKVLGPPKGMTEDQVQSIMVWAGNNADGSPVIISCWKPTAEELAEIQRTGQVWLMVFGNSMQPVVVTGKYPFVVQ